MAKSWCPGKPSCEPWARSRRAPLSSLPTGSRTTVEQAAPPVGAGSVGAVIDQTAAALWRLRSRNVMLPLLVVYAVCLIALGAFLTVGAATTSYTFAKVVCWPGGVLCLAAGLLCASLIPPSFRYLEWTFAGLRIPKGYKTIFVPTEDIAGMGLFYRKFQAGTRAPSGWFACVLRPDGSHVQLTGLFYAPSGLVKEGDSSGRRRRLIFKGTEDELASTSPEAIRGSAAGTSLRHLYDLVLEAQGPNGKLATMHMEKNAHWSPWSSDVSAYWSPDGDIGHVKP